MSHSSFAQPAAQGLYDPANEHDACGIGLIAHLRGERSHEIVRDALVMLANLAHRSATGGDDETGDGAGILIQLPHALLRSACKPLDIPLPDAGTYGVGMMFLPADDVLRRDAIAAVEDACVARGYRVLGWRDVPVDDAVLSLSVRRSRPEIRQFFVTSAVLDREPPDAMTIERELYVIRRAIEGDAIRRSAAWYVASLSSRTIVYKGLLRPEQLPRFYADLRNPALASGLALVHSRYSTNTFPSWQLAHPYRYLCHNGEINTVRGNLTWMRSREAQLASPRFGADIETITPIAQPAQSDSASLDNIVELLVHGGRPIAHAMAMLVPEAWEGDASMSAERRAFYEYHASLMEPWDGPAAIAFTDGRHIGALQDRNGLRPARWLVTDDDRVVLASEIGALEVPANRVRARGRLQPGRMLLVNTTQGRLLHDDDIKSDLASLRPYRRWVADQQVDLTPTETDAVAPMDPGEARQLQRVFGYTREELAMVLAPMATNAEEPVGSMGNDAPLAVLSRRRQSLFAYFHQLFAQVTNPAIDPIRERVVMSLETRLGAQGNVLDETPEHARVLRVAHPVLDASALAAIRSQTRIPTTTLATIFAADGPEHLGTAVHELCEAAVRAVRAGAEIVILTDRGIDGRCAPIPSLLAVSAVHHRLLRDGLRARASLVSECGDAREVSHVALLFAYGASAVHPYLALESCRDGDARVAYLKAIEKGLLKILSKMGVSTIRSYCGAQLWQAVGLDRSLVDRHFAGTSSPLGGIGLTAIASDVIARHADAFGPNADTLLDAGGDYHYRAGGEHHAWSPSAIATLQRATRERSPSTFREFARIADEGHRDTTLRGLLDFVVREPVPLDEVEASTAIVRRFATGAMSFGSISREAHETLAVAMNQIGGRSNTGEGGEDADRFGTERNSAIKQVASARFGVTTEYLISAREIQIKIAQGAKPGEGGQLPGYKVDAAIARTRHATPGVTLISPPPHHDIYSIEDLKQLVYDLRSVNPSASVSVKLVSEAGVGTVAAGVAKAGADVVVIAGDSGGTGAAPLSSIKRAGVPWELGLAETQQTLMLNGLRGRVRVQVDGQLKTARDVVIAALLGAEEFGFATAPLIVEGCVMMRKCHLNTCPVGIATQDPVLREKFTGKPEHLVNYFFFLAEEIRAMMAQLGFRGMEEMVGHTEVLRPRSDVRSPIDLAPLLHAASLGGATVSRRDVARRSPQTFDEGLLDIVGPAIETGEPVRAEASVRNVHRAIGATISGRIAMRHGSAGLPPDTITVRLTGSAGQSFGAFAARGLTLDLAGQANDYVGKGLSGGRLIIRAPKTERVLPETAVVVGNTALYGATSGEAFIGGEAGERFAVRNSGAIAVVEGVGDHACEYMTGGIVVILGHVGRNFAAGMSGGVAYVFDDLGVFRARPASPSVELASLAEVPDRDDVRGLIERYARCTGSRRARRLIAHWPDTVRAIVRVLPLEYKHALERASSVSAEEQRYG